MTFKEKLEKFLKEPIGFRLKSEEIAEELAKVLDGDDRFKEVDGWEYEDLCGDARCEYGNKAYLSYDNQEHRSHYGSTDDDAEYYDFGIGTEVPEFLNITLRELKKYNSEREETNGKHV